MQASTLNLSVDALNSGSPATQAFARYDDSQAGKSVYIGENHSLVARDELALYRSFPTKSGNFNGVGKSSFKFTRDVSVPGVDATTTITSPLIIEVRVSAPVGVSDALILEHRQRALALLDDDAIMVPLNTQLSV